MSKKRLIPPALPLLAALAVAGCFGGKKLPPYFLTLTSEAAPQAIARRAAAGESVTIEVPLVAKELAGVRIPVQQGAIAVAYVKDAQWVEPPARLLRGLIAETLLRTTNRVVLDPKQASLDPGITISGTLTRFGYDADTQRVVVRYDATRSRNGGNAVEQRRFEATAPANGTAATVGPALQRAANQVARDVAGWVG